VYRGTGQLDAARTCLENARALHRQMGDTEEAAEVSRILDELERQTRHSLVVPPMMADLTTLSIAPNCHWFRRDPLRKSVSLARRRSLRLILARLVQYQVTHPGSALTVEDLLSSGWPGERVLPKAGADRVYVAVRTLRRLGLDGVLLTRDDGYLIDPSVRVEWTEHAPRARAAAS